MPMPTNLPPSLMSGLRQYLLTKPELTAYVQYRVFVEILPENEAAYMPRAVIVLQKAGGGGYPLNAEYITQRIDVRCYGANSIEVERLMALTNQALKLMSPPITINAAKLRIINCYQSTAPIYGNEPLGLGWQFELSTWVVVFHATATDYV